MKACQDCHYIVTTKDKECPNCEGDLSDRAEGFIMILDPEKSEVAEYMDINVKGNYAIRVK